MRDLSNHEKQEAQRLQKLMDKQNNENNNLTKDKDALDKEVKDLQNQVSDPDFYTQDHEQVQARLRELADTEALLEQRLERWGELESLQTSLRSE